MGINRPAANHRVLIYEKSTKICFSKNILVVDIITLDIISIIVDDEFYFPGYG